MEDTTPVKVPMSSSCNFTKLQDGEKPTDAPYRQVLGSLMYAMVSTRPDLSYAVSNLAQFMSNPGPDHWKALKTVLRYIKGTLHYGLLFKGDSGSSSSTLLGYSDSDFARDLDTRRSYTGFCFFFNDSLGPESIMRLLTDLQLLAT